ncbi:otoferlin-like isoform X2 [Sitophilus oryzae]|uniref:Otoferlin-like isoform X2 n=1 Tax=Sitophilus oryzae TaxID=7048 RepID=A0A6J2YS82_SITOR|nr:otoferlin-like isoform X2 [Sitophilus oryzae]
MSIAVKLKQFQVARTKGEKLAKIEFRGVSHLTKILEDNGTELIIVDQRFDWPIARPVDDAETITIELYSRNRLFADKLIGSYKLLLQKVVQDGRLCVCDSLVDSNNKTIEGTVEFTVLYSLPDASLASFAGSSAYDLLEDDQQVLIDIEQNIANIERNLLSEQLLAEKAVMTSSERRFTLRRGTTIATPDKVVTERKRSTLKSVKSLIKFGKQRPPKGSDTEDETASLIRAAESGRSSRNSDVDSAPMSRAGSDVSLDSNGENQLMMLEKKRNSRLKELKSNQSAADSALKAQDFQVCLTIIEARQLAGLNMDPVVCIQVGDQRKYTSVKESTNCPYYNEYFVFDFHMPPIMLFDKIIQLSGKTSVKKHSYAPIWNEQLVFTEMFPPLCQRIKIQLRDDDPVKPTVIGTHFVDLKTISNDGEKGFLPTFGPCFVHLYGSTRDYTLIDEHSSLNTGLGEGVSYRARLLISIRTEITDNIDLSPAAVELEPTVPVNEASYAKNEEFFLFTTILDASMIDKKLGDKPVYFEVSIGNAGNAIDGHNTSAKEHYDSDSDELETVTSETASWQSTTTPSKPMTHDKIYYFLPYWDNKPCMHIRSIWPDYRRRMYNSNIIGRISEKLEDGLEEVNARMESDDPEAEGKLKQILEDLSAACAKYVTISKASGTGPGTGKTKLDKERLKLCQRELEHIGNSARNLKALVTKNSFKDRLKTAQTYLAKLKFLTEDPQHALPDVFLWIICGGKRQAYQRIPARDIIYSIVDEESGKDCGRVQTMFLKLPGKKGTGPSGWTIPAKLQIYVWLGMLKHKKHFITGIPKGYEISQEIRNVERPRALPPSVIHYVDKHVFQLRAHIYQARSLIGSDASGLSDPFARIIAGEFCKTTQVIDETLSPTWDELLVFEEVLLFGSSEEIKKDPLSIIIEIFDQDKVGKSEFIGRAMAKPHVKLREEPYNKPKYPPSLEWFTITRGVDHAGELLAVFELLEIPSGTEGSLPNLPQAKDIPIYKDTDTKDLGPLLPVPRGIRPTLARYRIEVLFWGLRDLKRIHLLTVDKPRVDIECAGHILYSSIISNSRKNPNFSTPVKFLELDLPEQELYRPPLTIRAVDCRSFGRYTLVGTHTINSIHKYMYTPTTKKDREAEERKKSLNQLKTMDGGLVMNQVPSSGTSHHSGTSEKEKSPLLPKDVFVMIGYGTQDNARKTKTDINKKRKHSVDDDFDDEEGSKDWWTKYFASVERMISESKEAKKGTTNNGNLKVYSGDEDSNPQSGYSSDKSPGQEYKKRFGFKTAATASRLAARISPKSVRKRTKYKPVLCRVYPTELEALPEFEEFKEWLHTFELYRGKKTGEDSDDESRVVGHFKGAIKVYKWPLPKDIEDKTIMGFDPQFGFFQGIPSNDPIRVLVRVYIVKANDLHPMDLNGKADPYVVLQLGSKRISDKENYISKQLNPVFGKCFEIEATFPQDSLLTVQIFDWDLVGSDDMVGETKIDLENRFYSKHRATCGLPEKFEEHGYNAWRDAMKPTQILAKLCKDAKIETPVYSDGQVKVGSQFFTIQTEDMEFYKFREAEEHMALAVIHRWHEIPKVGCHLVPEHVETRPLYNPDKPGIEQGKLEMWVDMFPMDMPLPGPPLDISPRKPKSYELRVIIWNTDEVVLEDDAFFTGEKMSDIYVKGWLKGPEDCQATDIHYRSLTGEGNFNWRYIFPFEYLVAEQKIVISRKESLFSWDETECKIPARLELQVWDADHFSADDFLGAVTLDLNRFPRGAKSSKLCALDMLKSDESVPVVNIFKQKRVKGWWPFYVKKDNEEMELTGKVEAEIHLLTKEEAEKVPVGLGRNEPDPLEKPNRPDSSFMWFMNPIKSIRYILWHNYKWTILKLLIILGVAIIILLFFYSIPGYTVKKMLGA